jgi:hypothetical protein
MRLLALSQEERVGVRGFVATTFLAPHPRLLLWEREL